MPEPAVTVVVPTRDRAERLGALLHSLAAQTLGAERFEVVVVDDGSRDGTPALLERAAAAGELALRRVRRDRPGGPTAARNSGWPLARADLVAFVDDDCEADPRWLERGLASWGGDPATAVQGRVDPIARELERQGPFSRTIVVHAAGPFYETCNMFYPRALLERLGGFDERFPHGGEDTDLGWRALEAGARVRYADDARVYHAVADLGPLGRLRVATRWAETAPILRRHPGLRRAVLRHGVFWKPSHALLLEAGFSLALARRFPPALLLALPYARHLAQRCRAAGASPAIAPYFALHDLVETATTLRGAVKHRVLVV